MPPHRLCPVKNTAFDSGKHSTIYFPCTCKREQTWTCMQTYNIERYWFFFKTLISFWKYYYRFHRMTLSNLKIYHEFLHLRVLWTAQDGPKNCCIIFLRLSGHQGKYQRNCFRWSSLWTKEVFINFYIPYSYSLWKFHPWTLFSLKPVGAVGMVWRKHSIYVLLPWCPTEGSSHTSGNFDPTDIK